MRPWPALVLFLGVVAACGSRTDVGDGSGGGSDGGSGSTTAPDPPDTSATGDHGAECADIDVPPGVRVVAHRNGGSIRLEASRMAITCSSNADSLCGGETCYGYGIDTLNFPASLGPGSHDMAMLADDGTGDLFCSSCDYVGICAIGGLGYAPGTLIIEELTDTRIRGCVRASADACFDVAFDVAFCGT